MVGASTRHRVVQDVIDWGVPNDRVPLCHTTLAHKFHAVCCLRGLLQRDMRLQTSRIIGQHGVSWTVAMTCTLLVQHMPPPCSITNSNKSSRPWTLLSRDMGWHALGAT